jgi:hypothetical protein
VKILAAALTLIILSLGAAASADERSDWRQWRGPTGNGVAAAGQTPPTEWSDTKNVVWKTPVPGRGHSSPTVVGGKIILTTADEETKTQSVVCFDRATGKQMWGTEINRGGFPKRIHPKNTHATPTAASNGKQVFVTFDCHASVLLAAVDLDGKILWKKTAGAFEPRRYPYGYAPSPTLYRNLVIVSAESDAAGFLAAFDQKDGREVWRAKRMAQISYTSPIVANVAGREQLLMSGAKTIAAYDPATGKELWSTEGLCTVTCGTVVWDDQRVFVSGGYPQRGTIAIHADGSGKVAWKNTVKCYEQSLLVHNGYVYAVDDGGTAYCWKADTGEQQWRTRLGGNYSASPILAGGNIYVSNERGATFVFQPDPTKFQLVARNQLGESAFATPTFCGNRIYARVATRGRDRREWLYCIGGK